MTEPHSSPSLHRAGTRFDVVIVGAGPAGLAAAVEASYATSSVAVVDQNPGPGGQIWRRDPEQGFAPIARRYIDRVSERATLINRASVIDVASAHGRHRLLLDQEGRTMMLETGTIVLATGARELFLPFPGWTLPGVVGVGGLQALMKSGLDVSGKRVVIAGTGPLLMAVAATAARKGAEVVAVVEQASMPMMLGFSLRLVAHPFIAFEALRFAQELPAGSMRLGSWVAEAHGADRLREVTIRSGNQAARIACDYLACAYGLVPNVELARVLGCETSPAGIVVDRRQATTVSGVFAAGECTGIAGEPKARAEGVVAGNSAGGRGTYQQVVNWASGARRWGRVLDRTFALRPEVLDLARPDTIVCRCEDVRRRDIDSAWTARQAKLYARVGMGACQGRICGAAMQRTLGWEMDSTRAPLQPAALSSLLGAW
jgi:D-hydroxyproline dehydrogenase subunit alpha